MQILRDWLALFSRLAGHDPGVRLETVTQAR